jgi:Sulfotransferase family
MSAPPEQPERPLQVVYVMGAGHSGSTILGAALGNCAGSFYAGEVEEWLAASGEPGLGGSARAEFWRAVAARVDRVAAAELFGPLANRHLERSSALLRVDRWPARRRLRRRYRAVSRELLEAIAAVAGVRRVVDSSHFPLRARELERIEEIELYLVMLVRDPHDVVASNVRTISRRDVAERRIRIAALNASLWLTHLLSTIVFVRHPRERRVFVRHEDFVADPDAVLARIVEAFGFDAALPDLGALRAGLALMGNKLILDEAIAVRRSTRRPRRWSLLTTLAQACWPPIFERLRPVAKGTR